MSDKKEEVPPPAPAAAPAPVVKGSDTPILIAEAAPEENTGPTAMQKARKFIHDNVFLQHILLVPVVILTSYYIGGLIIWPVFLAVSVVISLKRLKARKQNVYDSFIESQKQDEIDDVQEVAWLNQIVTKYWISCVPALVKPHIDGLSATLTQNKPPFMHKLEVGKWSFGKKGPRLTQIRTPLEKEASKYVLDGQVIFTPDFSLELRIEPVKLIVVKLLLTNVAFKGRLKIRFNLNDQNPNASIVSVCFVGDPQINFAVSPMGAVDMLSLPKVHDWLNDTIINAIRPMMVWPQKLQFTLGQGEVVSEHSLDAPVTDIAVIDTDELSEPAGFLILEKSLNGSLPADLNLNAGGKNMYLTYRRETGAQPITGLAVVCPALGELPPEGFTVIKTTPSGLSACLNSGNKGQEMYLCYTRAPGPPITGLAVMNLSQKVAYDTAYTRLEFTTSGLLANTTKETKGDPIFFAYRGGSQSHFGYDREYMGTEGGFLRVELVEAQDLKAADVGGTSDPFCTLTVDAPDAKKPKKKTSATVDKTLEPVWDEFYIFRAKATDVLTIDCYDYDVVGSNDFLGKTQLSLANLVQGKQIDQWVPLQLTSKGLLHIRVTALDWGLPAEGNEPAPLAEMECQGSQGLLGKFGGKVTGGLMRTGSSAQINKSRVRRSIKDVKAEAKARAPEEEFLAKKGHVEKLPTSGIITQGWQRRWFVADGHKLSYYRSHKDAVDNQLGSVGLKNATIEADEMVNEYTFSIVTKAKTIEARASNEEEFAEWFHILKTNIHVTENQRSRFESVDDGAEDQGLGSDVDEASA